MGFRVDGAERDTRGGCKEGGIGEEEEEEVVEEELTTRP